MDETMTAEPSAQEIIELCTVIDRTLAKMDELRERMRRDDVVIEESSRATRARLADIAELLAELKAA